MYTFHSVPGSSIVILIFLVMSFSQGSAQQSDTTARVISGVSSEQDNNIKNQDISNFAGRAYRLEKDAFTKGFSLRVEDLIPGQFPGLVMTPVSGEPGGEYNYYSRGVASISEGVSPLILVNKIPVEPGSLNLNPEDVQDITWFPGGMASALFGWEAGNGAIVINTKRVSDKFRFNYSGKLSYSEPVNQPENFNAESFRFLIREKFSGEPDMLALAGEANTNWIEEVFQPVIGQDHHMAATGTNLGVPWRVSAGYSGAPGIVRTSAFKRTTAAISVYPEFFDKHLKISMDLYGAFNNIRRINQSVLNAALYMDPTQPVYAENDYGGYFTYLNPGSSNINPIAMLNPVALLEQSDFRRKTNDFSANFRVSYSFHFLPDLKIVINGSQRKQDRNYTETSDSLAAWTYRLGEGGFVSDYKSSQKRNYFNGFLNYSRNFSTIRSKINISAGYNYLSDKLDGSNLERTIINQTLLDSSAFGQNNFSGSLYGFVSWSLMEKYLVNVGIQSENSSVFSMDNRKVTSPSFGIVWRIANETFMKKAGFIDDFNLRMGFSKTPGGKFGRLSSGSSVSGYSAFRNNTVVGSGSSDHDLKPEVVTTFEYGADLSVFNRRITASFTRYNEVIDDQIVLLPTAPGANFSDYLMTNAGKIENKGIELMINSVLIRRKNLKWNIGFNLAKNKNTFVESGNDDPGFIGYRTGTIQGGVGNTILIRKEGSPVNSYFVFAQVYTSDGLPIEGMYYNISGSPGIVTDNINNMYTFGKADPDYVMGINTCLSLRKWYLNLSGRIHLGNYVYNNVKSQAVYDAVGGGYLYLRNQPRFIDDAGFDTYQFFSDFYVEDASFFRLDFMNLGYTFTNLTKKNCMLEVYGSIRNVLLITRYSGQDPEVPGGIDKMRYPNPRTWMIGVKFGF